MDRLFYLAFGLGILPLALGLIFRPRDDGAARWMPSAASILQCALAFNLTFFWQELWLVIPKAMTPGLHPILFHNNHDWSGTSPITELLQGTGAIATLVSGLVFSGALALAKRASLVWRLFFFWMAFQGLFQALVQLAIGSLLSGNDVGRALVYLGLGTAMKIAFLLLAAIAMAAAGYWLARRFPGGPLGTIVYSGLFSVILIIPFRVPRNAIEVVMVPLIINLIGTGWLILGGAIARKHDGAIRVEPVRWSLIGPGLALCATLLFFQLVLRPGIPF
ncbi:MAG TPA: hypothetical protein VMU31_07670 [Rhizomicrobium sp.]|nr:hypothetical protein [Rhizomicrobium sp.]